MSASILRRAALSAPSAGLARRAFTTTAPRDLARITIVGNLAAPPELHPTSTGAGMLRYAVASNSGPRDNRVTSWFRVTSFAEEGPKRDFLMGLPKGTLVYIDGDATISLYEDEEGKTRSSLNVVQRSLEVLKRPQPPAHES